MMNLNIGKFNMLNIFVTLIRYCLFRYVQNRRKHPA